MTYSAKKIEMVEKLIQNTYNDQLDMVEAHLSDDIGIFMPELGMQIESSAIKHNHPAYQFTVSFDEKVTFQIGDKKIVNKAGHITGFSPNVEHCETYRDTSPHYIVIFIDKNYFEAEFKHYDQGKLPIFEGHSIKVPTDLLSYLKSFMIESDNSMIASEVFLKSISVLICHSIIRGYLDIQLKSNRVASRFEINCTIEYMNAKYDNKLTLQDLAQYAKMSKTHFSRVFKEETGQSVMDYLNEIRLENVKRLLIYSEKSITEIALMCGFSSSSYLSTSFHTKYGITPSAYKNKLSLKENGE